MIRRTLAALLLLGSASASGAEPEASKAEQQRLVEELGKLARKNAWSGVDRTYRAIEALGDPVPVSTALLGAQAARVSGDALVAMDRLERSLAEVHRVGPCPEGDAACADERSASEQLADLRRRYGAVRVTVYSARVPRLDRPEMPFSPEEQTAIERARRELAKQRRFLGVLPVGSYALDEVTFDVEAQAPILDVRVGEPPVSGSSVRLD